MTESTKESSAAQTEMLNILLGTRVLLDIEGIGERLESRLVGSDSRSFLLLTTPVQDGCEQVRDQYYLGREAVGRFLSSGRVHGFRSHIKHSLSRPSRLLFLSYPSAIEKVDLRANQRFTAFAAALLQAGSEEHSGLLLDISRGGCCVRIGLPEDSLLRVQEDPSLLTLRLAFPSSDRSLSLQGSIRDSREAGGGIFELGICFTETSQQDQQGLNEYLDLLEGTL